MTAPAPSRQGPRPLPLHLGLAAMMWQGSCAALPSLKSGSPPWKPELEPERRALAAALADRADDQLLSAVEAEARGQFGLFLQGIVGYRNHSYRRAAPEPPTVWRAGSSRLFDYSSGRGQPLLVVPSLVNRSYILDLLEDRSFLRFLSGEGWRPFLLDWGAPGATERGFTLTDYIADRLDAALTAVQSRAGGKVVLVGYCMGGLMVLPLAQRRPRDVAAVVALATPWDFHKPTAEKAVGVAHAAEFFLPLVDRLGEMPVDLLQSFFVGLDPFLGLRKFIGFARMDPTSENAHRFVALEDWLNDGVPLVPAVARECFLDWYGRNTPAAGRWVVDGGKISPRKVESPALVVVPGDDQIVPPESAESLAQALPRAELLHPAAGHIGMMAGRRAVDALYRPVAEWLRRAAAPDKPRAWGAG